MVGLEAEEDDDDTNTSSTGATDNDDDTDDNDGVLFISSLVAVAAVMTIMAFPPEVHRVWEQHKIVLFPSIPLDFFFLVVDFCFFFFITPFSVDD